MTEQSQTFVRSLSRSLCVGADRSLNVQSKQTTSTNLSSFVLSVTIFHRLEVLHFYVYIFIHGDVDISEPSEATWPVALSVFCPE